MQKKEKNLSMNASTLSLNGQFDCNTYNIVYAIICKKETYKQGYKGKTKRLLKFCIADHRGYIVNKDTSQSTGLHFNLPGHSLSDLSINVLEQAKNNY